MPFNNLLRQARNAFIKHLSPSPSNSNLPKAISFSSQIEPPDWVSHNQLFQRHPRLRLLDEQRCREKPRHLKHLLSYVVVSGLHRNPFVMSRLLYLSLIEMEMSVFGVRVFDCIEEPNVFSWNTMIRFFAGFDPAIALHYYVKMLRRGISSDRYTFTFLLQACGANFDLCWVQQVHCHVVKVIRGDSNVYVKNSLLGAYFECESETNARLAFDEMSERDVVSWTCFISGLVAQSNYSEAVGVFRDLVADDDRQTRPNVVTIISTISACAGLGSIDLTKCLHSYLEKAGWFELDLSVVNTLMDAYAKCGDLCNLQNLFDGIRNSKRDLYSWTAIISGYAMHGRGLDALNLFFQMEQKYKLIPDDVTFVAILSACAHSGLVEQGLCIFESMITNYRIVPDLRHYGCIVDLLGRAGMIERAYNIVENIPMEPNLAVLGSLLNSCRLHNNLEFGKAVLRKIELLRERAGAPVLLSNIYAYENQWSEVVRIRKEMRERVKGKKPPGRSWIQIKDVVHEFVARSESDTQAMELQMVLEGLEKLSKL